MKVIKLNEIQTKKLKDGTIVFDLRSTIEDNPYFTHYEKCFYCKQTFRYIFDAIDQVFSFECLCGAICKVEQEKIGRSRRTWSRMIRKIIA